MHFPGPQDGGGLARFPVFKKLKSKSAVIFLKYILLNKTSTLDASSKLRNMFKMTWLIIRRLFQDVSNPIFLVKEFKLSSMMYGLIRRSTWSKLFIYASPFDRWILTTEKMVKPISKGWIMSRWVCDHRYMGCFSPKQQPIIRLSHSLRCCGWLKEWWPLPSWNSWTAVNELGFHNRVWDSVRRNGTCCQSPLCWMSMKTAFLLSCLMFSAGWPPA